MVRPFLFKSSSKVLRALTPLGSSPEVGSSKIRISGSCNKATASAKRFFIPSEKSLTGFFEFLLRLSKSSNFPPFSFIVESDML